MNRDERAATSAAPFCIGGHQLAYTAHFCLLRPWKVGQTQGPDFPTRGDSSHYLVTHIST